MCLILMWTDQNVQMENKYEQQKELSYFVTLGRTTFYPCVRNPIIFKGAGSAKRSEVVKEAF